MSGEAKTLSRFRKNIKRNWKETTMANIIDDETIEYVGILAKLALSEEEKEQAVSKTDYRWIEQSDII